jgi:hypothetical protein
MIGHKLQNKNEKCYNSRTQTFSPTKQPLRCTGIADRVTLVSSTLLAWVRSPDFHVGIRAEMESKSGYSSDRLSMLSDSGIPRYLQGNGATTQGNTCCIVAIISSLQRMGVATHLSMLVTNPDAPAKSWRIW